MSLKETLRPEAAAAAQRVKDLARDLAQEVTDGYRRSTRYFKLRAAVVATWALLSAATLWIACPGSGAGNALGAVVELSEENPMDHQIFVQNTSDEIWTDVVLTLDGGWQYRTSTVRNGAKDGILVVAVRAFQRDGQPAPGDLRPRSISIACGEGEVTTPLAAR